MKDLNLFEPLTTLRRVRNPSAPSPEEVWQQLRQHRAEIPARLEAQRTRSTLAQQESLAQVEQHEPSSRDKYTSEQCKWRPQKYTSISPTYGGNVKPIYIELPEKNLQSEEVAEAVTEAIMAVTEEEEAPPTLVQWEEALEEATEQTNFLDKPQMCSRETKRRPKSFSHSETILQPQSLIWCYGSTLLLLYALSHLL